MREIKFRAWDRKNKMIMDLYDICFLRGGIRVSGTGVYIGNGWATEANGFTHRCDVELMQYTGLKDKNCVEIYEGDVVKCCNNCVWLVSFLDGCYVAHDPDDIKEFVFLYDYDFVVVGNIYENPELLKC